MSTGSGKLTHGVFESVIRHQCGYPRPEVMAGAAFGVDVAVVDTGAGMAMALTSDPLSLIPSLGLPESAWLSVHLLANDMATTGFAPMYGQFVLNLPATFSKSDFDIYWQHVHQYCSGIGVAITGGHTGFIEGHAATIAGGGTFITVAPREKIRLSTSAQPGDVVLVTKSCAISSAAILAMSFPETVKNRAGIEVYQKACAAFYDTSSLPEALMAGTNDYVTAMHDVTEGGVLGAIYELTVASGNGVVVYNEKLPIAPVQSAVCGVFDLDARYCVGAGAMVIACKKEGVDMLISELADNNIACAAVGLLCEKEKGRILMENETAAELPYYGVDPYWAAFFKAFHAGLS